LSIDHQSRLCSFIVKIWTEEISGERPDPIRWHGQVTHVPSGERRFVKRLDDISGFISNYLREMGVQAQVEGRMKQWIKRVFHQSAPS